MNMVTRPKTPFNAIAAIEPKPINMPFKDLDETELRKAMLKRKPRKGMTVQQQIIAIMSDGRERTTQEIADRVGASEVRAVAAHLVKLAAGGKVACQGTLCKIRIWKAT